MNKAAMLRTARRGRSGTRATARGKVDWIFVGAVLLLTALGLVMAYSTTFFWSQVQEGSPLTIFSKQLLYAVIGLVGFALFGWLDYGILRRFAVWIMAACLAALIAVILFGDDVFGARRTLLNGSLQPSEMAKLGLIIYAAAWLASRRDQVRSLSNGLIPFGLIVGVVSFLVVIQPDLSTTAVIVIVAMVMFFMAGASWQQLGLVTLIAVAAFLLLIAVVPHATIRVNEFIKVWRSPSEMDYHIRQTLITLGGGGLFGNGIGAGGQKFGYLPTPHTDSVIAVLGDEMGLLGLVMTLALFVIFAWRGLRIAQDADTAFGSFIAIGVVIWVIGQMLLNMMAILAMIPFTGVPVPFLSVGGSSLVSLLAACGVVISVGRGSQMLWEGEKAQLPAAADQAKGGRAARASFTIRRRHGRARFARAHRAQGARSAVEAESADAIIVGRDIRTNGAIRRRSPGAIRGRGEWDGA
ncbi:MAG: FtsW/RodA/SpoVE family cell cycle protein [Anaerolineae bacterium]|nr:FtsW/RodA/SpoVE family cell cycle protein [Anaerolineae bacterium]